jgi:hypothetical protein
MLGAYTGPGCPRCSRALDLAALIAGVQECPHCRRTFEAVRFTPTASTPHVVQLSEAGPGGATACGNHAANASVADCGRCGVFMCTLCRIDIDGQVLCPPCFERLFTEGHLPSGRMKYKDYTRIGTSHLVLGLLIPFIALITGFSGLYYGIRGLRQRRELGDGTAAPIAVIALGAVEAIAGVAVLALLIRGSLFS